MSSTDESKQGESLPTDESKVSACRLLVFLKNFCWNVPVSDTITLYVAVYYVYKMLFAISGSKSGPTASELFAHIQLCVGAVLKLSSPRGDD